MHIDRERGYAESLTNFARRISFADMLQHLDFAATEPASARRWPSAMLQVMLRLGHDLQMVRIYAARYFANVMNVFVFGNVAD